MALPDHITSLLAAGPHGRRLVDNAGRLQSLVRHLLTLGLIPGPANPADVDLACAALQLVQLHPPSNRSPMTLRDRAASAAELLISAAGDVADDTPLLDRTCRLLQQLPQRTPSTPEARLLADAVNLEDFGVTGLLNQMASVAVAGDGVTQLLDACATREQYGYWDARLARFHFPAVRELAVQRLANARHCCTLLRSELPATP